jgi:hypothetical protein
MQAINIIEKNVLTGIYQFIIPFSLKNTEPILFQYLKNSDFQAFNLKEVEQENKFYGRYRISHRDLEQYFLPFTNRILFPQANDLKGFRRYSKSLNEKAVLKKNANQIPFSLHSIDITICPYELCFLTLRTEINHLPLSEAIEFASAFQTLEQAGIEFRGDVFSTVTRFIFDSLIPGFTEFLESSYLDSAVFQSFPIAEHGGMFVHSLISLSESENVDVVDVYRAGMLNGLSSEGMPNVQPNNYDYIRRYVDENSFDCWLPNRYYFITDITFTCITNEDETQFTQLASEIYGQVYYSLFIQLFHKTVFLDIVNIYAKLNIENDTKGIAKLIYIINSFTSNYFFLISPSQTNGKELFKLLRKHFNIDFFYDITKEALFTLFKYEENTVTKKDSTLLLILTVYTVICGIFSMNLFTHDLVGNIPWSHLKNYNPFESFAVFVVFSGILVAWVLLIQSIYQAIIKRRNIKKWAQQTVLSSKRPFK